jgi:hypothetical protein
MCVLLVLFSRLVCESCAGSTSHQVGLGDFTGVCVCARACARARVRAGQLGLGDSFNRGDVPSEAAGSLPALNLGTGRWPLYLAGGISNDHMCAVVVREQDGTRNQLQLLCWGGNQFGQLGLGNLAKRGDSAGDMGDALFNVDVGKGVIVSVSLGWVHTCVVLESLAGNVSKCWGYGWDGQVRWEIGPRSLLI